MTKITKLTLKKMYGEDKKSTRKIAKELGVGKTTIGYYLNKFEIKRRSKSEANKIHSKNSNWIRGLNKEKDERVKKLSQQIKRTYNKKRKERIKQIEKKFNKKLEAIIYDLYWKENLNQQQISEKIGYDRSIIIDLMKKFNISKRPKYQYISSLKGEKHSRFGKKWEDIFGEEKSKIRKKEHSARFRKLTLKRIENNEFPFFDTKIEVAMAKEMMKKNIPFVKQFNFEKRYICDFAIPFLKILIECDGDYWHANPAIYKNKELTYAQKKKIRLDKLKNDLALKKGWVLLRFFESEINGNVEKCVNKIEGTIKKIKPPIDTLMN